ncbi:MAG: WG repeat-containing protein [Saprospiraceae bacterium]
MRNSILLFLLLLSSGTLLGQTQNNKTIHELLQLKKGCNLFTATSKQSLSKPAKPFNDEEFEVAIEEEVEPARPPEIPTDGAYQKAEYAANLKAHFEKLNIQPIISFSGQLLFQDKNYKWGLKNKNGKVLLASAFDFVQAKEDWKGFIGLKNGKFNYYDATGKPFFPKGYNFLERINESLFVVANQKMKGVIDAQGNSITAQAYNKFLPYEVENQTFFFAISGDKKKDLILPDGKIIGLSAKTGTGELIDNQYLVLTNNIIDLKTGESLFCDDFIKVTWTGRGEFLRLGAFDTRNEKYYLMDKHGNLLSEKAFDKFPNMYNGFANVELKTGNKTKYGKEEIFHGAINEKFEEVIPRQYHQLSTLATPGLFRAKDAKDAWGVLNSKHEIIMPFKYSQINFAGDYALGLVSRRPLKAEFFDLKKQKKIADTESYRSLTPKDSCGGKPFFAAYHVEGGQQLINEKLEAVVTEKFNNIGVTDHLGIVTEKFESGYRLYKIFSCDGQPLTLNINGKDHTSFKGIKQQNETTILVTLMDDQSYFYFPKTKTATHIGERYEYLRGIQPFQFFTSKGANKKQGLLTQEGKSLLPNQFKYVGHYNRPTRTVNFVFDKKTAGIITWTGDILLDEYESVYHLGYHLFRVKKNGKDGVVTIQNKVVVPLDFSIISFQNGVIRGVTLDKEELFFGMDGKGI